MTPDLVILLAALASTPLGLGWVEFCRRNDEKKERRRNCRHVAGETRPVAGMRTYHFQRCDLCGAQRHVEADGTPFTDWR